MIPGSLFRTFLTGSPFSAYTASKFAIRGLTQTAGELKPYGRGIMWLKHIPAQEWGKHGIRVNAYAPGAIRTEMCKLPLRAL
jgi:NAD(P)-dependent dehydrogenase (short-subunit alcohol dehydrogenase family)